MTAGQVENWTWESVWGIQVPKITLEEKVEWSRLCRAAFHSNEEDRIFRALSRKVVYRRDKLAARKLQTFKENNGTISK